jgi:hypothetical protein
MRGRPEGNAPAVCGSPPATAVRRGLVTRIVTARLQGAKNPMIFKPNMANIPGLLRRIKTSGTLGAILAFMFRIQTLPALIPLHPRWP